IAPEIQPDGISWAKGMGGGVPIGAFWLADRAIDEAGSALASLMGPGSHGSTYGGNPLVCAASLAVLREIREKELAAHALLISPRPTGKPPRWWWWRSSWTRDCWFPRRVRRPSACCRRSTSRLRRSTRRSKSCAA
ncbi:MAG: aminotransferase class III-fold pyridoxal phosphate-dependent enzyme, partial [Akkermansiaceae bacterium]|nr:aminotransferase class III-fold pyridoxal phosphate-dependent enzyme [Akkermansiaceae bacterium]